VEHVGGIPVPPVEVHEARIDGPYGFPLHGVLLPIQQFDKSQTAIFFFA
jgi:hypothetical protein